MAAAVHICRPPTALRKEYHRCPMCECTTEMVAMYALWYPTIDMCCRCGDSWSDGELHERPFRRGWRTEAIRHYRRLWDEATFGPPPTLAELEGDNHAA